MAPIRYSLHYEDYSEHLMSRFGKLLQMQSLVDMTLMCSSHTLRVHKAVLASSSAYFQEVLQKQTGEPLIILKMRFSVLKCLVEFMYCGKTQCLEENLDELVSAAQFLKIKGLSKVTKEGLGVNNHSEIPAFTPPVVINRPPQAIIDLHSQEVSDNKPPPAPSQPAPACSTSQPLDSLGRSNKDMVVRIPFDMENGGTGATNVDYPDDPRSMKLRRARRPGGGWANSGALGRAAERALMRREQDSRKAIHQLKHMQSKHMQDYMEQVSLSQAVNSICGPESTSNNYITMDNDVMYLNQTVSSNALNPTVSYSKDLAMGNETITSTYSTTTSCANESSGTGSAMSQYVNALKSAGLPTDLPILFESGDGSYINVNEQVLLDMVQSSEIQYEVIEQPNIIEKLADPSEIKSIDDLSKSIERGEMLMGAKGYQTSDYGKDNQYDRHEDGMTSLNSILPDSLEPYTEQQNYVVLNTPLQDGSNMNHVNSNDFSCIDGDMQFFTKSMSDDVKKYYEEQHLNDARVMEQLCPTSTALDTNFNISLLDPKNSDLSENMSQQYNPLNSEDLRRNVDCYDFGLQLPQSSDFKEDPLACLMATPKRTDDDNHQLDKRVQERDEIIKDLMNIEKNLAPNTNSDKTNYDFNEPLNVNEVFNDDDTMPNEMHSEKENNIDLSASSDLQWDENVDVSNKQKETTESETGINCNENIVAAESQFGEPIIDLTGKADLLGDNNKENEQININPDLNDIPFAVGLLPLTQVQPVDDGSFLKRKETLDENLDAKCLKRKVKYKKM